MVYSSIGEQLTGKGALVMSGFLRNILNNFNNCIVSIKYT